MHYAKDNLVNIKKTQECKKIELAPSIGDFRPRRAHPREMRPTPQTQEQSSF